MEIIKSFVRLGLVLLVLTSTAAAVEDGGPYWSVAVVDSYSPPSVYGAAWIFASWQKAEEAALEECQKRADKGCHIEHGGRDSCFVITRNDGHHPGSGRFTSISVWGPYPPSRAEAEAAAKREFAELDSGDYHQTTWFVRTIELVECAGVE